VVLAERIYRCVAGRVCHLAVEAGIGDACAVECDLDQVEVGGPAREDNRLEGRLGGAYSALLLVSEQLLDEGSGLGIVAGVAFVGDDFPVLPLFLPTRDTYSPTRRRLYQPLQRPPLCPDDSRMCCW